MSQFLDGVPLEQTRTALLQCGMDIVRRAHGATPTLQASARSAMVSIDAARELFATDEEFTEALIAEARLTFLATMDKSMEALPADASFEDRVTTIGRGAIDFAIQNPSAFALLTYCSTAMDMVKDFDADFTKLDTPLPFRMLLEEVRAEIIRLDGPRDVWLLTTRAMALFASFHGCAHLCTFGTLRHFSPVVLQHRIKGLIEHALGGVGDSLRTGKGLRLEPHQFVARHHITAQPDSRDLPRDTRENKREALYQAGVEIVMEQGFPALTPHAAAERAGLETAELQHLLPPHTPLSEKMEEFLNQGAESVTDLQLAMLPEDTLSMYAGKSVGVALTGLAMMNPEGFDAFITIASQSVVPFNFDDTSASDMGEAHRTLIAHTRACIIEGGGEHDPWLLFNNALNVWTLNHGQGQLFSLGPMRVWPTDYKLDLMDYVLDFSLSSFIHRLDLSFPTIPVSPITRPGN